MFDNGKIPALPEVVTLRGRPITGVEPRCGMVFQSYALFPWKTVRANVEFGPKMQRMPRAQRRERATRFIEMVKPQGFENHYPTELSGGMQQRATLARLLAADPEVLLMDEPFAALDAMTRQVMQEELLRIHEASGKTIVFITRRRARGARCSPSSPQDAPNSNLPRPPITACSATAAACRTAR